MAPRHVPGVLRTTATACVAYLLATLAAAVLSVFVLRSWTLWQRRRMLPTTERRIRTTVLESTADREIGGDDREQ